jgi:hypothetical protein
VELAPLVEVPADVLESIRRLKRPAFAYVPTVADQRLVADLDRTMTVEKAVIADLSRMSGVITDREASAFAQALARKRARFAFPTSFNTALAKFQKRLETRAGKNTEEGQHVDAIAEIRVSAEPSWDAGVVNLTMWLIKNHDPNQQQWVKWSDEWTRLIDQSGGYKLNGQLRIVRLEDMRASEYADSHHLDLDQLSS